MSDEARFRLALSRVLAELQSDLGIGTLSEKVIHKTLKSYYEPDEGFHEVKLLGKVADIKNSEGITEIQTRGFARLKPKLKLFLPEYPVTVVYPLVASKYIRWLDKESGELSPRGRSTKVKKIYDAGYELCAISDLLFHENLTLKIVLLECEEYNILNGYDKTRKRGADKIECIPIGIQETLVFRKLADYKIFVPEGLSEEFRSSDYRTLIRSRSRYSYYSLKLAERLGLVEHFRNEGNAFIYKKTKKYHKL